MDNEGNNEKQNFLKVTKMIKDDAKSLLDNQNSIANETDSLINEVESFLNKRGLKVQFQKSNTENTEISIIKPLKQVELISWEGLCRESNQRYPEIITFEDILTESEIQKTLKDYEKIEKEFTNKTSILNKTDLIFLFVATALQSIKTIIFPTIADKFDYGKVIDKDLRLAHNDISIKQAHKQANDGYRDNHINAQNKGRWINILYQTPAYDITKGSGNIGINMGGAYHRMYTLGHDPILGWLFGVANILTDTITLNDFTTYNVQRNPMKIINENITLIELFTRVYEAIKEHPLNLPASIFAQAQHLKSDEYTKIGLPIPVLSTFNEDFASKLYKNGYDNLCMIRDTKIIGTSAIISMFFDMIIGLVHTLYRNKDEDIKLYEVKTRKILLISNSIASTSTVLKTLITKNYKNLDIGSLIITICHLFSDTKFILKLKEEYIENEIFKQIKEECNKIDELYYNKFQN